DLSSAYRARPSARSYPRTAPSQWLPLLAAARLPSAETDSTSIVVPCRNRAVPNRSVLPAGRGSSGGSSSGPAAATTGAGDGAFIGALPPEAAAHPTSPTASSEQQASAAGSRRGGP